MSRSLDLWEDLWLESSSWVSLFICFSTTLLIYRILYYRAQFNPQKSLDSVLSKCGDLILRWDVNSPYLALGEGEWLWRPYCLSHSSLSFSRRSRSLQDQTMTKLYLLLYKPERTVPTTCVYMSGLTSCVFSVPLREELLLVPVMGGGKARVLKFKTTWNSPPTHIHTHTHTHPPTHTPNTHQMYTNAFTCRLCSCCWILACAAFLSALAEEGESRRWGRVNRLYFTCLSHHTQTA